MNQIIEIFPVITGRPLGAAGTAPATNPFRITPSGRASINRGDKFDTQSVMVTSSFRF